jgi:type I restriction enzyme S subunit
MPNAATKLQDIGEAPIQIDPRDWVELMQILQRVVPTLEVWAFGSRARHMAKPYSDLDLALISPTPFSLNLLTTVKDAFDTSDLTIRVDVVDWLSISDTFRTIIARDKVILRTGV